MARTATSTKQRADAAEDRARHQRALLQLEEASLKRRAIKAQRAMLATYETASRRRTNKDWNAKRLSADAAIIPDAPTAQARLRQLQRDDPYAVSATRAFVRGVVGETGIKPISRVTTESGELDEQLNKRLDAAWWDWSNRPEFVEAEARRDMVQIQEWIVRELVGPGECLVALVEDPANRNKGRAPRYPSLMLQLIEAEQLDEYKLEHEGRQVRGGVEVNEFGRAVAYWIHPDPINDYRGFNMRGRMLSDSQRITADRVFHIFNPERARQTRALGRLVAAATKLRQLGQFDLATLLKARAEACIGMIIKKPGSGYDAIGLNGPDGADTQDTNGNDLIEFQDLMVARLQDGEDVTTFTPSTPGGTYQPFTVAQLRGIAAAAGLSYEQIARDFSTTNFSGLRQGLLEDRREFASMERFIINSFMRPLWRAFVLSCHLNGVVTIPAYAADPDRFEYAEFIGSRREWVDPAKDIAAIETAIKIGLTSRTRELAKLGIDYHELAAERAREQQVENGISPRNEPARPAATDPAPGVAPGVATGDDDEDETDDAPSSIPIREAA